MRTWVLAAVAAGVVAGCGPTEPTTRAKADGRVKLADATFATLDSAIKAHKGEVVVVDFWATWCPPCRKSFPHLVALHNRYADRGLACVSVSINDADDHDKALQFLRTQHATFENFHWKDWRGEVEPFQEHFKFENSIPHMVMFNKAGTLAWDSRSQPLSDAGVDELVKTLLDAK